MRTSLEKDITDEGRDRPVSNRTGDHTIIGEETVPESHRGEYGSVP